MKKSKNLLVLFAFLLTTLTSCDKADSEKVPEKEIPKQTTWVMSISRVYGKVELKEQSKNDEELIESLENEIKAKVALIGNNLIFTYDIENQNTGKVVRQFQETGKEITSNFVFETTSDNIRYLKIIDNGVVTGIFQINYNPMYILKDFTQDYSQSNNRIVSTVGGANFTIPR
jgi:hypothetical protein